MPGVRELLATWEAGQGESDGRRALLLHALARPADDLEGLLGVTVGARDADLLALRRALFGEQVALRAGCPGCGAQQEFDLDVGEVIGTGSPAARSGPGECRVEVDGWTVRVRPPTVADLLAAVADAAADPDRGAGQARQVLLARCVVEASRAGRQVDPADLPAPVQERVSEAAAEADPLADIRLTVPCVECGQQAKAVFDIGSCLWQELDAWARGILLDVHLLAGSYGWTEADVLALSPLRRRYYLELAGHA